MVQGLWTAWVTSYYSLDGPPLTQNSTCQCCRSAISAPANTRYPGIQRTRFQSHCRLLLRGRLLVQEDATQICKMHPTPVCPTRGSHPRVPREPATTLSRIIAAHTVQRSCCTHLDSHHTCKGKSLGQAWLHGNKRRYRDRPAQEVATSCGGRLHGQHGPFLQRHSQNLRSDSRGMVSNPAYFVPPLGRRSRSRAAQTCD
jgi:hypothetical protein